jgi:DNA-binding transcriptional regulator/RsmH inhibitor MraZ
MTKRAYNPDRGIYVNTFTRVLSRRGLVIPREYRETLAKRGDCTHVVMAKGCRSPHLACYATTDVAEIEEHLKHLRTQHPDNKAVEPLLVALAIDRLGRIKLPEEFMRYAELTIGAKVSVVGCLDCFEIWLPANLERAMAKSTVVDDIGKKGRDSGVLPFLGF